MTRTHLLAVGLLLVTSCRQSSKDERGPEDDTATTANDDDGSTCEEDDSLADDDDDTLPAPECGDSVVEPPEICEPGWFRECERGDYKGRQACRPSCLGWSSCELAERCGDGIINGPELCDGGVMPCENKYTKYRGSQSCSADCQSWESCTTTEYCGDGVVNGTEWCDGLAEECFDSFHHIGRYRCDEFCSWPDYSEGSCQTEEYCGDGIRNGFESCDGDVFAHCSVIDDETGQFYYGYGPCTDSCGIEDCLLTEWCGDNIRNGGEVCDGYDTIEGGQCHEDCRGMECLPGATPDSFWNCYIRQDLPAMMSDEFIRCKDGAYRFDVVGSDLLIHACHSESLFYSDSALMRLGFLGSPVYPWDWLGLSFNINDNPTNPYAFEVSRITYEYLVSTPSYLRSLLAGFLEEEIPVQAAATSKLVRGEAIQSQIIDTGPSIRLAQGQLRVEGTKLYITGLVIYWGFYAGASPARYRTIEAEYAGIVQ